MASDLDPELIGRLLVVLKRHPKGKLRRDYVPYLWYGDGNRRRMYLLEESWKSGLAWDEIQRHLTFMAKLGLIKHLQKPAAKEGNESELDSLNQWQLCSDEEFGDRFPSLDQGSGNGPGRADRGDGGNGRDGGSGAGGGDNGGGNDGGGGQGDDGQGGGRGIGEVLSHPVLFSLPEAEFDALIDNLFAGPGAP